MKSIFYFSTVVMVLFLFSCKKDSNESPKEICYVSNPTEELAWLKASIESLEAGNAENLKYSYYMTANLDGETVFYYGNCNPLINYTSSIQNCSGETLGSLSTLYTKLTDAKILWQPSGSVCNFND